MNHFVWVLLEKPASAKNSWADHSVHGAQNMGILGTDMKGIT